MRSSDGTTSSTRSGAEATAVFRWIPRLARHNLSSLRTRKSLGRRSTRRQGHLWSGRRSAGEPRAGLSASWSYFAVVPLPLWLAVVRRRRPSDDCELGWLAPQTAPVAHTAALAQTAPEVVAPTAAASPDLQRLSFNLASVHQSIDQLAAQLAADQRQMADDIAKLQADGQEILHKLSAAPPRPTAAPTPKPAPVTPPLLPSGPAR
jgi:hypothetical protein